MTDHEIEARFASQEQLIISLQNAVIQLQSFTIDANCERAEILASRITQLPR